MPLFKSRLISHGHLNAYHLQAHNNPHSRTPFELIAQVFDSIEFIPSSHASSSIEFIPSAQAFTSAEHISIGDSVINSLTMLGSFRKKTFKWGNPEVRLSYGDIIALAGDYYATADSDDDGYTGTRRNSRAVAMPLSDAADVEKALEHAKMLDEQRELEDEIAKGHLENLVLAKAKSATLRKFATDEEIAAAMGWLENRTDTQLRYYILTLENWDHFHPHCEKRYHGLHERAKGLARNNGRLFGAAVRQYKLANQRGSLIEVLMEAWNMGQDLASLTKNLISPALRLNAFADHFLTDAFSSGHLFGMRREVISDPRYNYEVPSGSIKPNPNIDPDLELVTVQFENPAEALSVRIGEIAGSRYAQLQHDEWCRHGVRVRCDTCSNPLVKGKEFTAYGDGRAPDLNELIGEDWRLVSDLARKKPQAYLLACAVASSLVEVIDAFFEGADIGIRAVVRQSLQLDPPWNYVFHAADKRCRCTVQCVT